MNDPSFEAVDLAQLLKLVPRPISWDRFKAAILPAFSESLVSVGHGKKVRRVVAELEAIDLSAEGQPPRRIESTADLSFTLISRYVASRPAGESPYTLRDRLMVIQHLARIAVEHRWLAVSPFALRPIRRIVRVGKPKVRRTLSREEIRRLFEVLRSDVAERRGWAGWKARRLLVTVAIAAYTGLRRNELLTLHVEDPDLEARVIRLMPRGPRGRGLKTIGSAKPVGLPLALIPIVRDWLDWRLARPSGFEIPADCPWLIPNLRRTGPWLSGRAENCPLGRLQAAGRRAGIPDVTWHGLRRTLATAMEGQGVGRSMIQRQLRHADVETTTEHYIKADEANIAEAMRDIDF